jgi:hypothetical protein
MRRLSRMPIGQILVVTWPDTESSAESAYKPRMAKICKLQEGREVIHCRVVLIAYIAATILWDRGRPLRIGGRRGELMEWARIRRVGPGNFTPSRSQNRV